ncbi:uncharacterized protein [Clytia hemisphaerica]|uniref:uncharacterized protein n=1 Tax=Clytia hemisphaerica TaxID=252671 RepID=UPI0034D5BBF1
MEENDQLRTFIRNVVEERVEEMVGSPPPRTSPLPPNPSNMANLVARTRSLIRNAAASANNLNTTNTSPAHPNRILTGGKRKAPKESIKNRIYAPSVASGFSYDYDQLKKLAGQGKIYARLKRMPPIDLNIDEDDDDERVLPQVLRNFQQANNSNTQQSDVSRTNDSQQPGSSRANDSQQPGGSRANDSQQPGSSRVNDSQQPGGSRTNVSQQLGGSRDRNFEILTGVFPGAPTHVVNTALSQTSDLDEAADIIAQELCPVSIEKKLTAQLAGKRKSIVHVNPETLVNNVYTLYKDPNLDFGIPLQIIFSTEASQGPGVDLGGLLRQFYTSFFQQISDPYVVTNKLFEGELPMLLPVSTAETYINENFVMVGKIISHYICQGGDGFPYLAPTIYTYIVTGCIKDSLFGIDSKEVASPVYKNLIKKICNADTAELEELSSDETLCIIIDEIRERSVLTEHTKSKILQSMVVFDVLIRRKSSLDQLREGLQTLGVLDAIKSHPDEMRKFFVCEKELSSDDVVATLEFVNGSNEEQLLTKRTIEEFSVQELKQLLTFATGSPTLFALRNRKIKVKFVDGTAFATSTCFFLLAIPRNSVTDELLGICIKAIIDGSGFNSS